MYFSFLARLVSDFICLLVRFVFLISASLIVLPEAQAQEVLHRKGDSRLAFPGDRYIGAPGQSGNLAYWDGDIVPQVIDGSGQVKPELEALSTLLFYARAAGVNVEIGSQGEVDFSNKDIKGNVNYLIVFSNGIGGVGQKNNLNKSSLDLHKLGLNFSSVNGDLKQIVKDGLIEQSNGCYTRWSIDGQEHVKSMAKAVDSGLDADAQNLCVMNAVISSFGVFPVTSKLSFKYGPKGHSAIFSNNSEVLLSLEAASFCRKEWGQYGPSCPRSVIGAVLLRSAGVDPN